jgi:hypothetical protein
VVNFDQFFIFTDGDRLLILLVSIPNIAGVNLDKMNIHIILTNISHVGSFSDKGCLF